MSEKFNSDKHNMMVFGKCLENMIEKKENPAEKAFLKNVLDGVNSGSRQELKNLDDSYKTTLMALRDQYIAHCEVFMEMVKTEQYQVCNSFKIIEYLNSIQGNIPLENPNKKYTAIIYLEKKKYPQYPADFWKEWLEKSRGRVKEFAEKRKVKDVKEPPKVKEQPKKIEIKINKEDSESEQPSEQIPKAKVYIPTVKRSNQEIVAANNPVVKENKNKLEAMCKYLESRKDLKIPIGKNKQISEFLCGKLDEFMKNALKKVVNIAKLKNKSSSKIYGDEFRYFSKDSPSVICKGPILIAPNSKISKVGYQHKMEIYTQLRFRQFKKEDQLRYAFQSKNEGERKIDKKVEAYLFKERPREVQQIYPWKEDEERAIEGPISISTSHIIYYLESHAWLKNSPLLFNAYQY